MSFSKTTELQFFLFIQFLLTISFLFKPLSLQALLLKFQCLLFLFSPHLVSKINRMSLKKVKFVSTFSQSREITSVSYILAIFVERKAALGRKFSCLGLQQSVAIAHDNVQAILIKRLCYNFKKFFQYTKWNFGVS